MVFMYKRMTIIMIIVIAVATVALTYSSTTNKKHIANNKSTISDELNDLPKDAADKLNLLTQLSHPLSGDKALQIL